MYGVSQNEKINVRTIIIHFNKLFDTTSTIVIYDNSTEFFRWRIIGYFSKNMYVLKKNWLYYKIRVVRQCGYGYFLNDFSCQNTSQ